ncbi:MAG TPA: PilZ domain-containing protein [Terriglobales bacterium]|nr:PilZ domain-containing protein [Terriglobales bacterium]
MGALPSYLHGAWPTERQLNRFKLEKPLVLTLSGETTVETTSLDVSEGGLGAKAVPGLQVGQELQLVFGLPEQDQPFTVKAVVRHASAVRCGFEFLTITPEQRAAVLRYGETLMSKKRPTVFRH